MEVFHVPVWKHVPDKKPNLDSVHSWNSISGSDVTMAAISSMA